MVSEREKLRAREVDLPRDATVVNDGGDLSLLCHLRYANLKVLVVFRLLRGRFARIHMRLEVYGLEGSFTRGTCDGLGALIDGLVLAEDRV